MEQDLLFDVILLGDAGVGKSCIMLRLCENRYIKEHNTTIGVEFGTCIRQVLNLKVKLNIWDTAGTENFRSITRTFYRRAKGVLLVYDVTAKHTFENLESWIEEIKHHCSKDVVVFLVGNQVDLVENSPQERQVGEEEAKEFLKKHGINGFRETSATNGFGVSEAFDEFCVVLINHLRERRDEDIDGSPGVRVFNQVAQTHKKKCC
jgi:small GTP-binding protein